MLALDDSGVQIGQVVGKTDKHTQNKLMLLCLTLNKTKCRLNPRFCAYPVK